MDNMDEISRNSLNWEDFFGSSLELAPSLLNLYDHRIATGTRDKEKCDDHTNDKKAAKSRSLPSRPDDDSFSGIQFRGGRLSFQHCPADRPVSMMDPELTTPKGIVAPVDNKKRSLSISSVSSTSLTSSPRLRKKRASPLSGDNTDIMRGDSQDSSCTLIPDCRPDSRVISSSESRQSVDSGCVEGEKNGDRYTDSVSVTSSETGSCRDETDSSSKDCSVMLSSHLDKLNSVLLRQAHGSEVQSSSPASTTKADNSENIATAAISSPRTSNPNRHAKYIPSLEHKNKSNSCSESHLFDINSSRADPNTGGSPKYACSSPNSFSRQEARMRFFSNYEDHTKQSFSLPVSIAEENCELASSSPLATSPNNISQVSQSSSEAASPPAAVTSPVLQPELRRDRSSQLSPTSVRTSKRSERHGSVSKHDRQPTSPRSGFSRVSKKKDSQAPSEHGSKSCPVYVSYVSRVVAEIIESERIYIASLKDIIHGYLEPLEEILDTENSKKDTACLFSNIRDIYTFGCTFLSDLEAAGADPVKVAQCFVKYNKGFVIYTDYCTNYPRAVEVLTRFMQHPTLSQLCKERQHSLGHALPLGAYLLKPVQRILKYHLLLHNIVKNCEKEKEEAAILERAFHHMTQMAHHINEMKRKHEHAVRIQEIQSQLEDYVGEDLTRLGELVLEGAFKVNGAKASRQVFLFERGLLISKLKEGGMLSCKTFIPCSNLMLIEMIPNDPLSFHIIPFDNPRGQDTLQARNMEQKRRWCHDIKQQILESFKGRIPDNAKNLIMQLGKDWDDDYISKDTLDSGKRNQRNAPEYLEKRRFRRKSGSRLPDFSLLIPQKAKKGGNKKNEVQSAEKISPRRSESRSPERHRRIFSKQNSATKGRSRSISSSSISLPTSPSPYQPGHPVTELKSATTKPVSKTVESEKSACPSPESPVYRKSPKKLIYSDDGMASIETEADIMKRPVSFLMARANPVLSEDITNLLVRCGGSFNVLNSPSLVKEQRADLLGISRFSLGNRCNEKEEFSDNHDLKAAKENKEVHSSDTIISKPRSDMVGNEHYSETSKQTSNSSANNVSSQKNLTESDQWTSRLISSPDLRNAVKSTDRTKGDDQENNDVKSKNDLQDLENVYENLSMTESHMSRRDMLNSPTLRQKCKSEVTIENELERWRKEYEAMASGAIHKNNACENILLKKKGLRLPNTSKLLSARENELCAYKNKTRHKLTSSEETLNTHFVRDMSFNENPFQKSLHTSSWSSTDSTSSSSSKCPLSVTGRPRGNSDVGEFMRITVNKENHHSLHKNKSSSFHQCSGRKEDLDNAVKYLSQIPYATPPRNYMTIERMKKVGSLKDTSKPEFLYQHVGGKFFSHTTLGAVSALSISPVTVTIAKPVSFNTSNLLRSKSTPITSEREYSTAKVSPKERPVSMDVDKLTEESNKLIAEMEEYISNSCENVKGINKFPTSLSAISVDEEAPRSNRLSVVSTISTSSYESQGSSSSDGLVGTLKSKLRAWARMRNDSEYSYPSAVTSDNEEQELTNSESGSALGLQPRNRSSWRNDSDYDTAFFEYTFSEPVSCMEHPSTPLSTEQIVSNKPKKLSFSESHPRHDSSITNSYPCEDSSNIEFHSCDDPSFSGSHLCKDSSIIEFHPCEDSVSEFHPCKDSSITDSDSCGDCVSESHPYEDSSTSELYPCEDYVSESQQCENSHSESHLHGDSSVSGLYPYEDYVSVSQKCENSPSESHPCEDLSIHELYPCEDSSTCESHQQENIHFNDMDMVSEKSKTLSLETEHQPQQIQFYHHHTTEAIQIPPSSANKSDSIQHFDSDLYFHCNQLNTVDSHPSNIKVVPKNGRNLFEESCIVKAALAEHLTETVKPIQKNSLLETSSKHESLISDKEDHDKEIPTEGSLESENESLRNVDNNQQEDVDTEYPRKSIREFVQNFEEMLKAESQKVLEVKRREPGVMVRQRLKSLRDSTLHGWRNSSPPCEEHRFEHSSSPPPTYLNEISTNDNSYNQKETSTASVCTKGLGSSDSLTKSVENLTKLQENLYLSTVSHSYIPNISYSRHSIPFCNITSNNPSLDKDICEFHYKTSDNQTSSGNQFIHRVHSGSEQSVSWVHRSLEPPSVPCGLEPSVPLPEMLPSTTTDFASVQSSSQSASVFEGTDSEEDQLVVMKGWVRALISKFQVQE